MSYGDGYGSEDRYQAAIRAKISRACYNKFYNKFIPAHPEIDWDRARNSRNSFIRGLLESGAKYGKLSDKQLAAITNSFAREDERLAERKAESAALVEAGVRGPSGRQVMRGRIVSRKWQSSQWGDTVKVLLAHDEGWKVWCTLPEAIDHAEVGDVIEVTLTCTPSENDPLFVIGKRPSGASIVERVACVSN